MSFPDVFEGPDQTLFLLELGQLRIIGIGGSEVVVPVADFVAFLVWVITRHPKLLASAQPECLKPRLAGLLLSLQSSWSRGLAAVT